MKKCDFYYRCSEEVAQNALPGEPSAFPPLIFPWLQDDGREVVLVPKRPDQCSAGEELPRLSQSAAKLFQHVWEREREEQAPMGGESRCRNTPGEEAEATWKGRAAHQHRGSARQSLLPLAHEEETNLMLFNHL